MPEMPDASRPARSVSATILQWFVDREGELRHFREMLAGRDPAQVLLVRGPKDDWTGKLSNGIGKTSLLKRLHREAEEQGVAVCAIDFSFGERFDRLWLIQRLAVALGSFHFETLSKVLDDATRLEVVLKVESSPGDGGVTFQGDVEIDGDVADRDIIKDNTFYLQADSLELRSIWQESINKAFFLDLAQLGLAEGVTFLFDSFEQAPQEASSWIEHQMLRRVGDGELPGVWMVIAGEEVPSLPSAWGDLKVEKHLEPLPEAEVRKYLKDKRHLEIGEAVVSKVYDITDGRPDLVALIADSPGGLVEEPTTDKLLEILVEGILDNAKSPAPEILRVAAIAEWFDAVLLADLLLLDTTTGIDERLSILQGYSFVQADDRGHLRFRTAVRRVLLETWSGRPTERRELHERAAHHFDKRAQKAADPGWREELERQAMGHWLVVDEREGQERLRALFENAEADYRLTTCELLLNRAQEVVGLTRQTQDWLGYFQGRLALARNDYDASATMFTDLLEETEPHNELHELAGWSLSQVRSKQGKWAEAIDHLESSLRYFMGQADQVKVGQVMLALGDVYLQQARALGGLIRPQILRRGGRVWPLEAIPGFLVALPFVIYAWFGRRWRFLPPLHHGMNYRNWTLARLLLTAVSWYRDAESVFAAIGDKESEKKEALLAETRQGLAQTYHLLGWWHTAYDLFNEVLGSGPVTRNAYQRAQVRKQYAETELAAGNIDAAIEQLEKSLKIFERYQDAQAQAEAQALLGQSWLEKGLFERGLAQYQTSLENFSALGDQHGTGLALHTLRRWVRRTEPSPEQAAAVEALIAGTYDKTYLPRVPDRLTAALEFFVSLSSPLLAGAVLIAFGSATLATVSSPDEFFAYLFSLDAVVVLLWRLILFILIIIIGTSLLGVILITWGARQKLEPGRLNRIVTSEDAISLYNYRGEKVRRIPWREVRAILSLERVLWQKPIPLLSRLYLYSPLVDICVPGTTLWYDALKTDIESHLQMHNVEPVRHQLDVHVLRSRMGLFFMLSPILLGLGGLIVYNLVAWTPIPFSLSPKAAAFVGPALVILGQVALVAGPYWWLVIYPIWTRYELSPGSRAPLVAGAVGLGIVSAAFALSFLRPFFPLRNWLDQTVHPLGFVLIVAATSWLLTARKWVQKMPIERGELIYREWMTRAVVVVVLLGAVLLTGLFARREWVPYVYVLRSIADFYRDDYEGTVADSTQALFLNRNSADGYFYRARAYNRLGKHEKAILDFDHLVDSGSALPTDYLYRAEAYQVLGNLPAACADLRTALEAHRWRLGETAKGKALDTWEQLECDSFEDMVREGDGS